MSIEMEDKKVSKNNIQKNEIIMKDEEEKDTKDSSKSLSLHFHSKGLLGEKNIDLIPGRQILNDIQKRLFILSPTVELGFERECNKYDFIRDKNPLGKGAFGEVWKVTHENSNKIYCIKMMQKRDIFEQKLNYI